MGDLSPDTPLEKILGDLFSCRAFLLSWVGSFNFTGWEYRSREYADEKDYLYAFLRS